MIRSKLFSSSIYFANPKSTLLTHLSLPSPAQNGKDKQITGYEVCSSVSSRHFLMSPAPKTCCQTQLTTALFQNDSDDWGDRDDYMRTSLRSGVPIVWVVSKNLSKWLGRLGRLYENQPKLLLLLLCYHFLMNTRKCDNTFICCSATANVLAVTVISKEGKYVAISFYVQLRTAKHGWKPCFSL